MEYLFYPSLPSSTNPQNFVSSSSSGLLHTSFHSSTSANFSNLSFPIQTVSTSTNNTATILNQQHLNLIPLVVIHCVLFLKETPNVLDNRIGVSGPSSSQTSNSSSTNISQSKYSALSLISDPPSYSEPPSSSACHSEYVHSSVKLLEPQNLGSCFPPTSFNNNYSQSAQKTNCCHFPHRTLSTNPELPSDICLPVGPPVPSFHTDKTNFQTNRSSLPTSFSQNNANFVGNIFYNTNNNVRDVNDMTVKPSNIRSTQEAFCA
ncbi:hypothetical protein CEXT_368491 [Caerostris extrusa]|uniref:Uncharacterized protein n=1 Tax=Caerostris extrusa TaxID=172846 RepID=A0AAV4SCJ6_CAEEX|nr:hypothetical protein CEXT_368491 [Caerostris extrusa]